MNAAGRVALARTMAADATTVRTVTALRNAGIDPILLKGPSFAAWLYGANSPRTYVDSDLLIPPASIDKASRVLSGLGYVPMTEMPDQAPHSTTWLPTAGGADVDLHTRLPLTDESVDSIARLEPHTTAMQLGGIVVTVLDDPAKAVHVVIHAVQDSLANPGPNHDLLRALRIAPDTVWAEAAHLANQLGAADAFAVGLSAFPEGRALCGRIGLDPSPSVRASIMMIAEGSVGSGAGALEHLSALRGWQPRLRFVVMKLVPPKSYVDAMHADTGAHRARTLRNYTHYWLRSLRKVPGAVRVWNSTRGAAGRWSTHDDSDEHWE